MKLLSEFKTFAMRGNVVDMAIGIIIGAAFGKIVNSAVADMIMPPIGLLVGGVDFSDLKLTLRGATAASESGPAQAAVTLNYGLFINHIIDFVIVAFAVFVLVKAVNTLKKKEDPPLPPGPTRDQQLLGEIRDILKARG